MPHNETPSFSLAPSIFFRNRSRAPFVWSAPSTMRPFLIFSLPFLSGIAFFTFPPKRVQPLLCPHSFYSMAFLPFLRGFPPAQGFPLCPPHSPPALHYWVPLFPLTSHPPFPNPPLFSHFPILIRFYSSLHCAGFRRVERPSPCPTLSLVVDVRSLVPYELSPKSLFSRLEWRPSDCLSFGRCPVDPTESGGLQALLASYQRFLVVCRGFMSSLIFSCFFRSVRFPPPFQFSFSECVEHPPYRSTPLLFIIFEVRDIFVLHPPSLQTQRHF